MNEACADGISAIAETCPHYLILDDSLYSRPDAARYVMTPPLRDRDSLKQERVKLAAVAEELRKRLKPR